MKKIDNWPITEADTDFSKLQKNKNKKRNKKISKKKFFPFFLSTTFIFFSYKKACDYFSYLMNLMNSMFMKHM